MCKTLYSLDFYAQASGQKVKQKDAVKCCGTQSEYEHMYSHILCIYINFCTILFKFLNVF